MITKETAQEIIEHLKGSCDSLEQTCEDFKVDTDEFLNQYADILDDQIFNCENCGWWCETSEIALNINDRLICTDCCENAD